MIEKMWRAIRSWYDRNKTDPHLLGQMIRKARRFYLGTFRQDYVARSIEANRQGECHRCGACCELVYKCPFLGRDSQKLPYCRIYGDLRPGSCRNYPFDAVDSEIERCGFKFPKA